MSFFKDFLIGAAETGGEILDERRKMRQVEDMKKADELRKIDTDAKIQKRRAEIDEETRQKALRREQEENMRLLGLQVNQVTDAPASIPTQPGVDVPQATVNIPSTLSEKSLDELYNIQGQAAYTGNKSIEGLVKAEIGRRTAGDKQFDRQKETATQLPTDPAGKTPVAQFQEYIKQAAKVPSSVLPNAVLGMDVYINPAAPTEAKKDVVNDLKRYTQNTEQAIANFTKPVLNEYGTTDVLSSEIQEDALKLSRAAYAVNNADNVPMTIDDAVLNLETVRADLVAKYGEDATYDSMLNFEDLGKYVPMSYSKEPVTPPQTAKPLAPPNTSNSIEYFKEQVRSGKLTKEEAYQEYLKQQNSQE